MKTKRKSSYPIQPLLLHRWSPRAMSGEPLNDDELMALLEAARWAPSSMNNQLWRFVYAKRDSKHWDDFLNLLFDGNKMWCKNAAALIIIISRKNAEYKNRPQYSHSLETGAAMQNMLLEASARDLVGHAMGGFDVKAAHNLLKLSDVWRVEAMIAIGKPGDAKDLPQELQEREEPSDRKPLNEIVFEGELPKDQR